jgi:hypothetical protein
MAYNSISSQLREKRSSETVVALLMICVTKFTPSVTLLFIGEMYCKDWDSPLIDLTLIIDEFDAIQFHSKSIIEKTTRFQAVLALLMMPVTKFTPPVTLQVLGAMHCKDRVPADRPNSYY